MSLLWIMKVSENDPNVRNLCYRAWQISGASSQWRLGFLKHILHCNVYFYLILHFFQSWSNKHFLTKHFTHCHQSIDQTALSVSRDTQMQASKQARDCNVAKYEYTGSRAWAGRRSAVCFRCILLAFWCLATSLMRHLTLKHTCFSAW